MKSGETLKHRDLATFILGCTTAISLVACAATTTSIDDTGPDAPLSANALQPIGPILTGEVVRVVDGDTVRVLVDGTAEDVSVRLIGIDTPETVAPGKPVECFGPEASAFAESLLAGARVQIELDPSQGETDRFGRLLGYVWIDNGSDLQLFNLAAVREGYAIEYQYDDPYTWQAQFEQAQRLAESESAGQWSAC
ncbi:MAG: thermonuclease family protein [Candidatus Nanopelagicales bacterium]